jgi:hypothetical protein
MQPSRSTTSRLGDHLPDVAHGRTISVVWPSSSDERSELDLLLAQRGWTPADLHGPDAPLRSSVVVDASIWSLADMLTRLEGTRHRLDDDGILFIRLMAESELLRPRDGGRPAVFDARDGWTTRILDRPDPDGACDVWVKATPRRPLALLLLGPSGSGKTNTAVALERHGFDVHHGDFLLRSIAEGEITVSDRLRAVAAMGHARNDWSATITAMCEESLLGEMCALVIDRSDRSEHLCFEMMVPVAHHGDVIGEFSALGYWPVQMSSGARPGIETAPAPATPHAEPSRRVRLLRRSRGR